MSKIEQIKTLLSELLDIQRMGSTTTEAGIIYWDGDEPTVDETLYIEDENGEKVNAPEGEYKYETELGEYVITVGADGIITEVTLNEKEANNEEEKPNENNTAEEEFNTQKAKFEATYDEKRQAIAGAFNDKGVNGWVLDCADTFAIVEEYDNEFGFIGFFEYEITINENGEVTIDESTRKEVVQKWVAKEEKVAEEVTEEVTEKVAETELQKQVAELQKQVEEFKNILDKKAPKPVEVEFQNIASAKKTGASRFTQYL